MDDDYKMKLFNIAKEQLLHRLVKEKYITQEDKEDLELRWQFVLYKPKWYQRWSKATKFKDDDMETQHVKLVDFETKDRVLDIVVNRETRRGN